MPTSRFCAITGVPERTYRRWQARHRAGQPVRGPWPAPVTEAVEPYVVKHAEAHPAWGHRKIWALCRYDGHQVSPSTVERIMRRRGLLQARNNTAEVRQWAAARRAAFAQVPTGPNQVWQLDFTEFETAAGGTWRIAGCADYYAKYEFGWHLATTQNAADAIAALRLALDEAASLLGRPLLEAVTDPATGEIRPVKVVTDNGPAFKSAAFARFIAAHPELEHIRTRKKSPNTNGVRERAFGSLKYERLYREEIPDGLTLAEHAHAYRAEFNATRPHEGIAMNRPLEVYLGKATPATPNFPQPQNLPST
jgi:putative transposase